jgi:uncharacterized phage-associated protein
MTSVKLVSKKIIQSSSQPISNLKLQKLLYYVQGWKLGLDGQPAFYEQIEAWVHGPVVPAAFYEYRHFGWNPIDIPTETVSLTDREVEHVANILEIYGDLSATQLESLSHEESPWIDARAGLDPMAISRNVISHEAMRSFFSSKVNG